MTESCTRKKLKIALLATGGTIAGKMQKQKGKMRKCYEAGVFSVEILLESLFKQSKEIKELAHIEGFDIANIDSANMSDEIWLKLHKKCEELQDRFDRIVITHGTDTMEESAIFLNLTLKKPFIMTGAMRAFDDKKSDAMTNLKNAVLLALNKKATKRGSIVTINNQIFLASSIQKSHTSHLNAFSGVKIGSIKHSKITLKSTKKAESTSRKKPYFEISQLESLPKVDILYTYANDGSAVAARALFDNGTKGIVIAGSGAGSIHEAQKEALKDLLKKGLKVAISSRVKSGFVALSKDDENLGFISAQNLNPQKARVLLMLTLTKTDSSKKIARYFKAWRR